MKLILLYSSLSTLRLKKKNKQEFSVLIIKNLYIEFDTVW